MGKEILHLVGVVEVWETVHHTQKIITSFSWFYDFIYFEKITVYFLCCFNETLFVQMGLEKVLFWFDWEKHILPSRGFETFQINIICLQNYCHYFKLYGKMRFVYEDFWKAYYSFSCEYDYLFYCFCMQLNNSTVQFLNFRRVVYQKLSSCCTPEGRLGFPKAPKTKT